MVKNVVSVPRIRATLPGDMAVQGSGTPAGTFSLSGAKLRETLRWLGIDTAGIPKERLQGVKASCKMTSAAGSLQITDAMFEFDDLKGSGGGTVTFGLPVTAAFHVELDRFDLDAYLPPPSTAPSLGMTTSATATAPTANLSLKGKVANVYRGETLNGVDGDVAMQGNVLKLNNLQVADLWAPSSAQGHGQRF
jgi:hypothetical protein